MTDKNIDALLTQASPIIREESAPVAVENKETVHHEITHEATDLSRDKKEETTQEYGDDDRTANESASNKKEQTQTSESEVSTDSKIDEYGNPIEEVPKKMYSEDEVNRMMRERVSRGSFSEQQASQVQKDAKEFIADPDNDESWEVQLANFIDQRLETKQKQVKEQEWKQQELRKQEEYQDKFNNGMSKYKDFHNVVANKPITDAMMLATRSLNDPAGFIYAASKLQPKELERIASIENPFEQAAEMGKLEAIMRRSKNTTSSASRPIAHAKGDIADKGSYRPTIDSLIQQHAKQKFTERR